MQSLFVPWIGNSAKSVSCVVLLLLLACSNSPAPQVITPAPFPFNPARPDIPDDGRLLAELADAVDFRLASNYDRYFDAEDPGEAIEHATLRQTAINSREISPATLFAIGDELFEFEFGPADGLGNALKGEPGIRAGGHAAPNLRRVQKAGFGGPDSYSCATCHSKGGPDGAGANTQNAYFRGNGRNANTADERSPPHVLGIGPVAALGHEMTKELQAIREGAIADALAKAQSVEVPLQTKEISFGKLLVSAAGVVDTSFVKGVSPDLVIRPFGWKGHHSTIRGIVEESFRIHMGLVSMREQERMRDGKLDPIDYGNGRWYDIDRDNVSIEIEGGMLTTLVAYLSQLPIPVVRPPSDDYLLSLFGQGEQLFGEIGCEQCHRPNLPLHNPILEVRSAEKKHEGQKTTLINVATDGEHPKIVPTSAMNTTYLVNLFSDLRRHDMGERLTSGYKQGTLSKSLFLTRPLWGLADTAPYLHDGRAPSLHDAIMWHGGDAQVVRDLYMGLEDEEQDALFVFLLSLDREPVIVVP